MTSRFHGIAKKKKNKMNKYLENEKKAELQANPHIYFMKIENICIKMQRKRAFFISLNEDARRNNFLIIHLSFSESESESVYDLTCLLYASKARKISFHGK
jgi:hypothetical protein